MAEIYVHKLLQRYLILVEDPNLSKNRLFIGTVGHDTTTLAPLFQQNWSWNYLDRYNNVDNQAQYDDINYATMHLEKGTIFIGYSGLNDDSSNWLDTHWQDTYHSALDYTYFPVKKSWKANNGNILMINAISLPVLATIGGGVNAHYLYNGSDITAGSGAMMMSQAGQTGQPGAPTIPTHYVYEDISNNVMWGINQGGGTGSYYTYHPAGTTTLVNASPSPSYVTPPNNDDSIHFFMGVDSAGKLTGVGVQDSTSYYSQYTFYTIHPTTYATTTIISQAYRSNTTRNTPRSWPSNIRRAADTRRVIYSSHFDASATPVLAPIRFVWNPTDSTVTQTNCTMIYPGANTFSTYSQMYTTEGASVGSTSPWHMKGQQFTLNGVNYITFWISDKNAVYATNSTTRWNSTKKRTMMTYSIGAGTGDDVLTYHSSYTFPTNADLPADWMPINSIGSQVMSPNSTGQLKFFTFNSVTGWVLTGTYPYAFRMLGLDQTNRIWGYSREKGIAVLHMVTPTIPLTISVIMASASFTFSGSNVSTSCTVDAYGTDGVRIATTVNLAIDGSTMIFAANSTKNLSVSTSASVSTTVNLTITGGGINNIIASVDV